MKGSKTAKSWQDHLLKVVGSDRFLQMRGLNNEIPFFICAYGPEQSVEMDDVARNVRRQLGNGGIRVLEVNLYDLGIALLKDRGIWDQILEQEPAIDKAELLELLQGVLDTHDHLIPAIAKRLSSEPYDVLFLTGIGEVFPYIRSHNVLNNLQSTAKDKPTVMFFPGSYTHSLASGAELVLFDSLSDDKYYRAFNIEHYEV